MKRLSKCLGWFLLFLPCLPPVCAEGEKWKKVEGDYLRADEEWEEVQKADIDGKADPVRFEAAVRALEPLLKIRKEDGPSWGCEQERRSFEGMDWRAAGVWAAAGKYDDALRCLRAQAAQPGMFLFETRNPDYFALDVFKLHAEIMAHTGKVADIPYSGYQVFEGPSSKGVSTYAFVWGPLGDGDRDNLVEGVAEDEQRHEITFFKSGPEKICQYVGRAQVVSKRGKLKVSVAERRDGFVVVLRGVTKFVEFRGEIEFPFVHPSPWSKIELRLDEGKVEPPLEAIARMGQI